MATRRRVGIYSPYIPEHSGGGERFVFSVAEALSSMKHMQVEILIRQDSWKENSDQFKHQYEDAFHVDLSRVSFVPSSLGTRQSAIKKLWETARYDILYYVTDGSFFFSAARKNIVDIQIPFHFPIRGTVNRLKLANWGIRNTNSEFEKRIVEKAWKVPVQFVHYPYVDTELFAPREKEKIILAVGRFFVGEKSGLHCKRQDVLVELFRKLIDSGDAKGWRLVLIGAIDPGEDNLEYAKKVAKRALGYPVKIFHDASFSTVQQYYAHASVFWHAAGYEVDEEREPMKVEHFGIVAIEAMASGAIPVVIGKGGLPEIIDHGVNGFLCETGEDMIGYTRKLIENKKLAEKMRKQTRSRAMIFSKERFVHTLQEMIR